MKKIIKFKLAQTHTYKYTVGLYEGYDKNDNSDLTDNIISYEGVGLVEEGDFSEVDEDDIEYIEEPSKHKSNQYVTTDDWPEKLKEEDFDEVGEFYRDETSLFEYEVEVPHDWQPEDGIEDYSILNCQNTNEVISMDDIVDLSTRPAVKRAGPSKTTTQSLDR